MTSSRVVGGLFLFGFLASHASPAAEAVATRPRPTPVVDESAWGIRLGRRPDSDPVECVAQACPDGWIAARCGGAIGCFPPGFECCTDGTWCGAGERCVDCGSERSSCVPDAEAVQCCTDGTACAAGTRCGSCGETAFCYAGPTICCNGTPHPGEACP